MKVLKDIKHIIAWFWFVSFVYAITSSNSVYAFTKLKAGLETITSNYLIPLSGAVAGASLILYVTLSFFKQEENMKKIGNVALLAIMATAGVQMIDELIQSFT